MGSHIIIVEIDENKHTGYDSTCEQQRLNDISIDVGYRSIVFIRFNPDSYIDQDGNKIKSCWRMNNNLGVVSIPSIKLPEWNKRIECLNDTINFWISNQPTNMVEIVELFY